MLWYFVSLDITNCFTHQQYKVQRKTEVYQRRRTLQGERMKHQQEEKRLARCWWFGTLHKLRERNELNKTKSLKVTKCSNYDLHSGMPPNSHLVITSTSLLSMVYLFCPEQNWKSPVSHFPICYFQNTLTDI